MRDRGAREQPCFPNLRRGLQHHVELAKLFVFAEEVSADARSESTLGAERQLLNGQVARGLVDPSSQLVNGLDAANFGRDKTEDCNLALWHKTQRFETPGPFSI